MKTLVFDSGPIISFSMTNLLWILESLKDKFCGEFLISPRIKSELIERPLKIKRFEFEALQVMRLMKKGVLRLADEPKAARLSERLLGHANSIYVTSRQAIKIVHPAEMEIVALAILSGSQAVVIDERTTRILIEDPKRLGSILSHKLHTKVQIEKDQLASFLSLIKNVRLIRSVELAAIAYEKGLLNDYLPNLPYSRKILLDAVLWGLKINGCSISGNEIDEIIRIEAK